jgi:hypothetical protein
VRSYSTSNCQSSSDTRPSLSLSIMSNSTLSSSSYSSNILLLWKASRNFFWSSYYSSSPGLDTRLTSSRQNDSALCLFDFRKDFNLRTGIS